MGLLLFPIGLKGVNLIGHVVVVREGWGRGKGVGRGGGEKKKAEKAKFKRKNLHLLYFPGVISVVDSTHQAAS